MKRLEGYVVGRKTIAGLPTWSVRVKQDGSELSGIKLTVASVAKGVTLRAGLDVDFVLATSIDLPMAADVAPKGVVTAHKKELTTMRRAIMSNVLAAAFVLALFGGMLLAIFKPWEIKSMQNQLVEFKVETNLNWIRKMTFWDIVPDQVIRDAVRQSAKTPSYGARQAVLDFRICPVFGEGYDKANSKCFNALYAADRADSKSWLERDGLPSSIGTMIHESRFRLLWTMRSYLMSPTNLQDAYFAKKSVIVDEFLKLDISQQKYVIGQVRKARNAFGILANNTELVFDITDFVAAQQRYLNTPYDTPQYNAARDQYATSQRLISSAVSNAGADVEWLMFAYRRFADGGPELTKTYLAICDDLLALPRVKDLN